MVDDGESKGGKWLFMRVHGVLDCCGRHIELRFFWSNNTIVTSMGVVVAAAHWAWWEFLCEGKQTSPVYLGASKVG